MNKLTGAEANRHRLVVNVAFLQYATRVAGLVSKVDVALIFSRLYRSEEC